MGGGAEVEKTYVKAQYSYTPHSGKEVSVKKGEILTLINSSNKVSNVHVHFLFNLVINFWCDKSMVYVHNNSNLHVYISVYTCKWLC